MCRTAYSRGRHLFVFFVFYLKEHTEFVYRKRTNRKCICIDKKIKIKRPTLYAWVVTAKKEYEIKAEKKINRVARTKLTI